MKCARDWLLLARLVPKFFIRWELRYPVQFGGEESQRVLVLFEHNFSSGEREKHQVRLRRLLWDLPHSSLLA